MGRGHTNILLSIWDLRHSVQNGNFQNDSITSVYIAEDIY